MEWGLAADERLLPSGLPVEITQQVREYAREQGLDPEEAVAAGLTKKSEEFQEAGGEIYS